MKLSYLKDMGQEYTAAYREIAILKIKNEADALEREFQNAAGGGGQTQAQQDQLKAEQELTKELMTEWEIRLRVYANFLAGMGDKAGAENALNAAKDMARNKIKYQNMVTENFVASQNTMFDKAAWTNKKISELDINTARGFIGNIDKMLDAAQTMYDKDSSEYARLAEWKKGIQVAQLALDAAQNVQKIAGFLAVQTAASGAAVANAGAAVTGASIGVGPTGFATAAAMIALMASVFSMYGIVNSGGGGSSASSGYSFSSHVLGAEAGAANTSITDTWELLEDTYDMEYRELRGIYDEMRDLNSNISGLVSNIIRTGAYETTGISGGSQNGFIESLYSATAGKFTQYSTDLVTLGLIDGLGGWVADLVGSVIGSVFGGDTTKKVTQSGISLFDATMGKNSTTGSVTIEDLLAGNIYAKQYAQIKTTTDGGWFSGDDVSKKFVYDTLDSSVTNVLEKVFENIGSTLVYYAEQLGVDVNEVLNYQIEATKINLKGMSDDEISETLVDYFSNLADQATEDIFGSIISSYQKVGEGLSETAARLIIDKAVVMETLSMTGQAFDAVDKIHRVTLPLIGVIEFTETAVTQIIKFTESLIEIAGGLEELTEAASTYYDKFFTDAEKQLRLQGQLTGAMSDMNLVLPSTREGYRAIVEALDLTKESDMEAYVAMLKLSESADEYYSYLEEAQQEAIDSQKEYIETLKDVSKTIDEWLANLAISDLSPVRSAETYMLQYESYRASALSSTATSEDISKFLDYANTYLQFQKTYGTEGSYKAIYDAVVADVTGLGDVKDVQLQVAEAQLSVLQQIEQNTSADAKMNEIVYYLNALSMYRGDTTGQYPEGYEQNLISTLHDYGVPGYASGGLAEGVYRYAENGPEWVVPTYSPQNKSFLKSVGADPETLGAAIGKYLQSSNGGTVNGGQVIDNRIYIDGKEICRVVTKGMKENKEMVDATKRAVN
jgi:hypothetical protein